MDSAQDGGEDHEGVGDEGEPVAPGVFDIGPAHDDGADAEGLQEHFQLAGPDGARDIARNDAANRILDLVTP